MQTKGVGGEGKNRSCTKERGGGNNRLFNLSCACKPITEDQKLEERGKKSLCGSREGAVERSVTMDKVRDEEGSGEVARMEARTTNRWRGVKATTSLPSNSCAPASGPGHHTAPLTLSHPNQPNPNQNTHQARPHHAQPNHLLPTPRQLEAHRTAQTNPRGYRSVVCPADVDRL